MTMIIVPNKNLISPASGVTLYVGGVNPGNYSTIQDAINAAIPGDTVFVYSGTYNEKVVVNKTINLIGEDRDTTTIYGGMGYVVRITEDWVNITGFTVTRVGGSSEDGLLIESDYNTISENKADNSGSSIHLWYSSGNNITGNTISEGGIHITGDHIEHWNTHNIDISNTVNGKPVYYWKNQTGGVVPLGAGQVILANCTNVKAENQDLSNGYVSIELGFSSNNNITGNTVSSNQLHGIFLEYSDRNNVTDNIIFSNSHQGIFLESSNMNNIKSNRAFSNENFGIYLYNSSSNTIIGNTVYSDASGIRLDYSDGNYIIGNNASSNIGFGIVLVSSNSTTIENNTCKWNHIGIRLDYSHSNTIENNTCNSNNGYGIQLFLGFCSGNNIVGNTVSNNNFDGIRLTASPENNITDNNVSSNSWNGIHLEFYSDGNNIIDNNISSNEKYGIYLYEESDGNKIIDNNISSNNYDGIYIWHSSDNDITNNNISNNEKGIGLATLSDNNIITDNIISSNSYEGILLDSSSNNKITINDISDNLGGINLISSSNDNTISGNIVSSNDYGIKLFSSSDNKITANNVSSNIWDGIRLLSFSNWNDIIGNTVFSNNNYGFYLNDSSNNSIYHNNIIDNINQAHDDTNNGNEWDNGYPSGGNYWSDFDEPSEGAYDDYLGPNQDDPTSGDGIVDNGTIGGGGKNPYVIDSNSRDNYPLINPADTSPPTITNQQPPDGSSTNNNIPTISADYYDPSGINVSSVVLIVDGIDVTIFATVTTSGVSYIPGAVLSNGIHMVYLEVKDIFGNLATATWSFTVDTFLPPVTNLTTIAVNDGNSVELEWNPPSSLALDHYLIYRAGSTTDFDFAVPYNSSMTWPDSLNTTWVDPDSNVTVLDDDFYYIVRAANFDESDISSTSNTAGVWTRTFQPEISTFSLPLEPFVKKDTEFYCQDMNASYIKWMNQTTQTWMRHDKGNFENNTIIKVGEGYEIGFLGKSIQIKYTFCGLPGAMITYDDDILFSGFNPDSEAKNLTVSVEPDGNVTLTWPEPASMNPGDWYEMYHSNTRDGFFGTLGIHYNLSCPSISYGANTTTITGLGANDPGARLYFMVVPFNSLGIRGASTYSIGIWTEEYLSQYDSFTLPLKSSNYQTADWFCEKIPNTVGINYYIHSEQRWGWHSMRMPEGVYDPLMEMAEGYQISTSNNTKFIFIGI